MTFSVNGNSFNRGSIIIARGDNKNIKTEFDKIVTELANDCQVKIFTAQQALLKPEKTLVQAIHH